MGRALTSGYHEGLRIQLSEATMDSKALPGVSQYVYTPKYVLVDIFLRDTAVARFDQTAGTP